MLLNTIFKLVPSFYCATLVQFHIYNNNLRVLYAVFCALYDDAVVFVIIEYEISQLFL